MKTYIERTIHFPYPLKLSYDTWKKTKKTVYRCTKQLLNVKASEFKPIRNASAIAEVRI